jgi:membrane-bound serine protease (ClpP class)
MWCHLLLIMPVAGLGLFAVLPLPIALPAYLVLTAISLLVYWSIMRAMHRPITTGPEGMIGARAEAMTDLSPTGRVRYQGELWQAVAGQPIPAGSRVTIVSVDGMRVQVQPTRQHHRQNGISQGGNAGDEYHRS